MVLYWHKNEQKLEMSFKNRYIDVTSDKRVYTLDENDLKVIENALNRIFFLSINKVYTRFFECYKLYSNRRTDWL